jgi:hypothetical protein
MSKFLLLLFFIIPWGLDASVQFNQPSLPYEPSHIDSASSDTSVILGDLSGEPHLFEFSLEATSTVRITLSQSNRQELETFSLLLIKVEPMNRGVREVSRFTTSPGDWSRDRLSEIGLTLLSTQPLVEDLSPGIYRFEVSTPDNSGMYLLRYQTGDRERLAISFGEAVEIRRFLGHSGLAIILSGRVLWPLALLILIGGLGRFIYRRRIVGN